MDWRLVGCARRGHVTCAPDEPELRDRLMAPAAAGTAWRCLRCGAFVAHPRRPETMATGDHIANAGITFPDQLWLRFQIRELDEGMPSWPLLTKEETA